MSIEVKIPAVGESISSGVVSVWHKKSGDYVNAGDALFTLETDKVSTEIVAEKSGLLETNVPEGQEVKIGEVVATIDDSKAPAKTDAVEKKAQESKPAAAGAPQRSTSSDALSPAVRRIVEEEKLEPAEISGTGKDGRLTKGDVLEAAQNKSVGDAVSAKGSRLLPLQKTRSTVDQDRQSQDGRVTRKENVAFAPQNRRAVGDGATNRRDSHHIQRMRHERRSKTAQRIAGRIHEKERIQARLHVVFHQSDHRSAQSRASD